MSDQPAPPLYICPNCKASMPPDQQRGHECAPGEGKPFAQNEMQKLCPHPEFFAIVNVARIEDRKEFVCEVQVQCTRCGNPFKFLGVPGGYNPMAPACSVDACELLAPIAPYTGGLIDGPVVFHAGRRDS